MTDHEFWIALKDHVAKLEHVPAFVAGLLSKPWPTVMRDYSVSIETRRLDVSYVDYLKEQIELGARGPEWNEVLKRRLCALSPYVGEYLTALFVSTPEGVLIVKFVPEDGRLVSFEADESMTYEK